MSAEEFLEKGVRIGNAADGGGSSNRIFLQDILAGHRANPDRSPIVWRIRSTIEPRWGSFPLMKSYSQSQSSISFGPCGEPFSPPGASQPCIQSCRPFHPWSHEQRDTARTGQGEVVSSADCVAHGIFGIRQIVLFPVNERRRLTNLNEHDAISSRSLGRIFTKSPS